MKRLIILILALTCGLLLTAQNRSIGFAENQTWKQIVKQAKKEKKLIFLDCYTSWCGPCQMLARQVFTKDQVADFFNGHFVNAKFDMEKSAEGPVLKKKYSVKAYPTLLFIDPKTEEVVHLIVGGGTAEWLIGNGKLAMDPDNNFSALDKRYTAGERGSVFLKKYLSALSAAYRKDQVAKVAGEYLDALPADEMATPENWELIAKFVKDPLSVPLRTVMAEREKFGAVAGRQAVETKLEQSIRDATDELLDWRGKKPFPEERYRTLTDYLLKVDFAAAPAGLAVLYTADYARKGDYKGMLAKMREVKTYNLYRNHTWGKYFLQGIRQLLKCKDEAVVRESIRWIDEETALSADLLEKVNMARCKELLLKRVGTEEEVNRATAEREKYHREFKASREK